MTDLIAILLLVISIIFLEVVMSMGFGKLLPNLVVHLPKKDQNLVLKRELYITIFSRIIIMYTFAWIANIYIIGILLGMYIIYFGVKQIIAEDIAEKIYVDDSRILATISIGIISIAHCIESSMIQIMISESVHLIVISSVIGVTVTRIFSDKILLLQKYSKGIKKAICFISLIVGLKVILWNLFGLDEYNIFWEVFAPQLITVTILIALHFKNNRNEI